jgi:uncharacterized Tic20 family protein
MTDSFGSPPEAGLIKNEEKLLALFSHLSLFFGGVLIPLIFWITNKDKSRFVAFHALQSLWFHVAYVVIIIAVSFILVFGGVGISLFSAGSGSKEMPVFMIIALVAFYAFLFLIILGGIGYSVYMAIKSYQGNYNRYPVIGKMVYNKVFV